MTLTPALRDAVDRECAAFDRSRLARAAAQMSSDYKGGQFRGSLSSAEARAAYLLTRLPATFAANSFVFHEVRRIAPDFAPESLLDFGAGPGTASWAASEIWSSLRGFTLIESNPEMLAMGKRLASANTSLAAARWVQDSNEIVGQSADMVVLSYVMGEVKDVQRILSAAWAATRKILVIVEPGTPKNFSAVAKMRRELMALGGEVVAPCPHHNECPMSQAGDWCHFAVRLERTSEHRRLKGGSLGYEDEKFSYLAISKQTRSTAASRIVRHPETHSGFIKLVLCTPEGLHQQIITRSQKEQFRAARRAKWGDEWVNWSKSNTGGSS